MLYHLIPRRVLLELLKIGAMALIAITGLVVLGGAMVQASRHGLDPLMVLQLVPYLIPPTLPYTLPVCLLFSCTFVYSRMAANVEITALKAGGINILCVLWPSVLLSVGVCALMIFLTDQFIPMCNRNLTKAVLADLQGTMYNYLRQHGQMTLPDFPYEIYVQDVRGERLINPFFKRRGPTGEYDVLMTAAEATLTVHTPDPGSTQGAMVILGLIDGMASSTRQSGSVHFDRKTVDMPLPPLGIRDEEKLENLTYEGCLNRAANRRKEALKFDAELSSTACSLFLGGIPHRFVPEHTWNREQAARSARKVRESTAEMHMRIAQSVVAIPFILLGCPIGMLAQRTDFLRTFFACFLPIITVYYPMMIMTVNVFKERAEAPLWIIWLPSAIMCILAVPFLRRVMRF